MGHDGSVEEHQTVSRFDSVIHHYYTIFLREPVRGYQPVNSGMLSLWVGLRKFVI